METRPRLTVPLAVVAVALAIRFVPGWLAPFTLPHFIGLAVGPLVGALGLLIWWAASKSIPKRDRWLGAGAGLAVILIGFLAAHPTMPQFLVVYGLVEAMIIFTIALVATAGVAWSRRRSILLLVLVIAWLPWTLMRQDGQIGELTPELSARWRPTAEELFLKGRDSDGARNRRAGLEASVPAESDWPGYRGPLRNAHARGVEVDAGWKANPPRELWRRRVGPGWSSFAVAGDRVFTQEQRGDEEVVASYSLADGSELWVQRTSERFEEPAAGAGPRATPTFTDGTLFALGAHGTLQALDALTGERIWRRNLVEDFEAPLPTWGFTGSPLVTADAVLVFAGATGGRAVVAFRRADGELLWTAGGGAMSYASVHLATLAGVEQALMASDLGIEAFDPRYGTLLWEHRWPLPQMARMVQPVVLPGGKSLILATGYGEGSRRLEVARGRSGAWEITESWSSRFLKPYFNGLVCHEGTCYGFDGKIFTAIGADDGARRWKGGRYGHGQVLLVPESDLLVVLTEQGEVVLVEATPEEHRELGRLQALTGKTWNHPVITQGKLLVRNAEEAACFELPG